VYSFDILDSKGGIGDPIALREEDVALLETVATYLTIIE
jgi:hypothetical protein